MRVKPKGRTRKGYAEQLEGMIDERRCRIASYKVRGFSFKQIEAALAADGVVNPANKRPWSHATIVGDVNYLRARWQTEALRDITELQAGELERLDELEREAGKAWYRSIGTHRKTVQEQGSGGRGDARKARVETEEMNGDPRYMTVILNCQAGRREMLGLNAPQKHEVKSDGDLDSAILAEWSAFRAGRRSTGVSPKPLPGAEDPSAGGDPPAP